MVIAQRNINFKMLTVYFFAISSLRIPFFVLWFYALSARLPTKCVDMRKEIMIYKEVKFCIIKGKQRCLKHMGNFVKFNSGWLVDKGYAIGTSLMFGNGYIGFDINAKNGDVCGLGGFCEFTTVVKTELKSPETFKNATLNAVFNGEEKILKGRASRIQWDPVMYLDEKNRIIMFGKFDYEKPSYRFLGNAFVQLDDDGDLLGIVLTDI